jgi:hypothetical protein
MNVRVMSMVWNYVCELQPPTGLFFIPQMLYDYGEPRWNVTERGNPKNSERNLSQCYFVRHKSHMDRPGHKPGTPR